MFDWRRFLPDADVLIALVNVDVKHSSTRGPWVVQGRDLSDHREGLAYLLAAVNEGYVVDLDDFQARNDDNKPKLLGRDKPGDRAHTSPPWVIELLDWERHAIPRKEYEELWRDFYGRSDGNAGTSRTGGPPLPPVHGAYLRVRDWWRERGLGQFSPVFDEHNGEHNHAARLLLGVLHQLNEAYTVKNAAGLHATMNRKDRKRREANGNRWARKRSRAANFRAPRQAGTPRNASS